MPAYGDLAVCIESLKLILRTHTCRVYMLVVASHLILQCVHVCDFKESLLVNAV